MNAMDRGNIDGSGIIDDLPFRRGVPSTGPHHPSGPCGEVPDASIASTLNPKGGVVNSHPADVTDREDVTDPADITTVDGV
jgi:hypothetical protein